MVDRGGTTQRFARALAGVALVLAVSGCTGTSSSATAGSEASEPSATPHASSSASSTPDQNTAPAWAATGRMITPRQFHTATLLPDGKVLVAGGVGPRLLASAELYDPGSGSWTPTGNMDGVRAYHAATLLPDGKVLVTGGQSDDQTLASAELYDPGSGSWTATGNMAEVRLAPTATLLPDGKVLVAGGMSSTDCIHALASAELYDPGSGSWTPTGNMDGGRVAHTATLLPDGRVLVAGGSGGNESVDGCPTLPMASAELYDSSTGFWTATGSMIEVWGGPATLLDDGMVLVAGINGGTGQPGSAELYDPGSGSWAATGAMIEARGGHTATLLLDGTVLVAGGDLLGSAELYDPSTGSWTATGNMIEARGGHTATLLPDGRVLVAGLGSSTALASAELYDPGSGT